MRLIGDHERAVWCGTARGEGLNAANLNGRGRVEAGTELESGGHQSEASLSAKLGAVSEPDHPPAALSVPQRHQHTEKCLSRSGRTDDEHSPFARAELDPYGF